MKLQETPEPMRDEAAASPDEKRRGPHLPGLETAIAILIGIVLGLAVTAAFVFTGSEEAIDAPRIDSAAVHRAAPAADETARKAP